MSGKYLFEVEVTGSNHGDMSSVAVVDRTFWVDEIGNEQELISTYQYGLDAKVDAEVDVMREAFSDLLAGAKHGGLCVRSVGLHKIILEDIGVCDDLVTSFVTGLENLRHVRVKLSSSFRG